MTLEEFKFIYFWEYGHRMMGRVIGAAYAIPAAYFIHKGLITRAMYPRIGYFDLYSLLFSVIMVRGFV